MAPRKKSHPQSRQDEKKKKMAYVIIEVVRATNDGIQVSQQDIRARVQQRWRIGLKKPTLSGYIKDLSADGEYQRKWLKTEGWTVLLDSEETTLIDSGAAQALVVGKAMLDEEDSCSLKLWLKTCTTKLGSTEDKCRSYLGGYIKCGYSVGMPEGDRLTLIQRAINRDMFYLRELQSAGIRKRAPLNEPKTT